LDVSELVQSLEPPPRFADDLDVPSFVRRPEE